MPPEPAAFDADSGPPEPDLGVPASPKHTTIETVVIACPRCGGKGGHPVESLGRRVECGNCGRSFLTSKYILTYCKTCNKYLKIRPIYAGQKVRCNGCGGKFRLRIPQGKAKGLPSSEELQQDSDPGPGLEPDGRPREDNGCLRRELEASRSECDRLRAEADRLREGLRQPGGSGVDLMSLGHSGPVEALRGGVWDDPGASAASVSLGDTSAPGRREPRPGWDQERNDLERRLAEQASLFESERRAWRERLDAAERRPAAELNEAAGQLTELRAELDRLRQAREADRRHHQRELAAAQRELEAERSEVQASSGRVAEAMKAAEDVERRLAEARAELSAAFLRADQLEAELHSDDDGAGVRVDELTSELRRTKNANDRLRSLLNIFGFSERA